MTKETGEENRMAGPEESRTEGEGSEEERDRETKELP